MLLGTSCVSLLRSQTKELKKTGEKEIRAGHDF